MICLRWVAMEDSDRPRIAATSSLGRPLPDNCRTLCSRAVRILLKKSGIRLLLAAHLQDGRGVEDPAVEDDLDRLQQHPGPVILVNVPGDARVHRLIKDEILVERRENHDPQIRARMRRLPRPIDRAAVGQVEVDDGEVEVRAFLPD